MGVHTVAESPLTLSHLVPHLSNADGGNRHMYVRMGGWLAGLPDFDAGLFRLAASEALCMDPQSRLLLEHGAELMQPQTAQAAGSSVGVFVGCMYTGEERTCHFAVPQYLTLQGNEL